MFGSSAAHKTDGDIKHAMCTSLACMLSNVDLDHCDVVGASAKSWVKTLELLISRCRELCNKSKHIAWALPVMTLAVSLSPKSLLTSTVSLVLDVVLDAISTSIREHDDTLSRSSWYSICTLIHCICKRFSDDSQLILSLFDAVITRLPVDSHGDDVLSMIKVMAYNKPDHVMIKMILPWLNCKSPMYVYVYDDACHIQEGSCRGGCCESNGCWIP